MKHKRSKPKKKSVKSKAINIGSKRKLDRFGKILQKGRSGSSAQFITRGQALKRLQISLKDFRRLCILKGIYPRDPKHKSSGHDKTYYHVKDILYCSHEPILEKFREIKAFMKKVKKSSFKKDIDGARRLYDDIPQYDIDHLIKERYPTFIDALKDLDDALSMIFLFSRLPSIRAVKSEVILMCQRLSKEWDLYCSLSHTLRKVFVSIKGIYYQSEIQGEKITWIVPYEFTPNVPNDVDFNVMKTFLEFYTILMQFILFKLYNDSGYKYPPQIDEELDKSGINLDSMKLDNKSINNNNNNNSVKTTEKDENKKVVDDKNNEKLKNVLSKIKEEEDENDDEEENENDEDENNKFELDEEFKENEEAKQLMEKHNQNESLINLFKGLKFFLSREVPIKSLEFIIKCFNGEVGYENPNSKLKENDPTITHQIVDRPTINNKYPNREYVQPQWVYDSINSKMLLPTEKYVEGKILPPHLSPFVDDTKEGYIPDYRMELDKLKSVKEIITNEIENKNSNNVDDESSSEEEIEFNDELEDEQMNKVEEKHISKDVKEEKKKNEKKEKHIEKAIKRKKNQEELEEETKQLKEIMMPKQARRLHSRITYGLNKKQEEINKLKEKKMKNKKKVRIN